MPKKLKASIFFILSLSLLSACLFKKPENSQAFNKTFPDPQDSLPRPVNTSGETAVIYLGGFTSCGYESNKNFPDSVNPTAKRQDFAIASLISWVEKMAIAHNGAHKTLITCFPLWTNFGTNLDPSAPLDSSILRVSGIPRPHGDSKITTFSNPIYFRHNLSGTTTPPQKASLGAFLTHIGELLVENGIRKVAIIGHSYGGYTGMQIAKSLIQGSTPLLLTTLVTLDPISMNQCLPEVLVGGVEANQAFPGCSNAPGINMIDHTIDSNDINSIASRVPWLNFWQETDKFLHSSAINVPGIINTEVAFDTKSQKGIVNHLFYSFPDNKKNPQWPSITNDIIEKIHMSLIK